MPLTFAEWITDRRPTLSELRVTFQGPGFVAYGGDFLATDGASVFLAHFNMPPKPKKEGGGYYCGYWNSDFVVAWAPLPTPPKGPHKRQQDLPIPGQEVKRAHNRRAPRAASSARGAKRKAT